LTAKLVEESMVVIQKFRKTLMDQQSGRQNESFFEADDLNQVKNVCSMMQSTGTYDLQFQEKFMSRTSEFY